MNIFFIEPPEGNHVTLPEEESMHCVRVLRMKEGDEIHMADGKGNFYTAHITRANPKQCEAEFTGRPQHVPRRPYSIHLAVAPTKSNDRFEWMLEKVTELGCERITPLICEHSERRRLNMTRLEKVLVSAMKQSMQAWLPVLDEPMAFTELVTQKPASQLFLCSADAGKSLAKQYKSPSAVVLVIGPEGDFSPAETAAAMSNGFIPCSLGLSRLRTETAGIAACHTIHVLNS